MHTNETSAATVVDPLRGAFFVTFDLCVIVTTFNIMLAVLLEGRQ